MLSKKMFPPPSNGWIHTKFEKEQIDFLWERIALAQESNKNHKDRLAGNISKSLTLTDNEDNYFFEKVLFPHVLAYREMNNGEDPVPTPVNADLRLFLQDFWVNYQYEGEFNPYHFHGGQYSFAIWMSIPTDWREQNELPFLQGMSEADKKASIFEFEYLDMLGNIKNYGYRLDSSMEGEMVFFPASLRHTVYPFYNCDKPRISVAGNLWFKQS